MSVPTVMVILGVTGDLSAKKIIPALFKLHEQRCLPELIHIIGVARKDASEIKIEDLVRTILADKMIDFEEEELISFCRIFSYKKLIFEKLDDFKDLSKELGMIDGRWGTCSNKLFYLAVPPVYYKTIFSNLSKSGLTDSCSDDEGWTRVIVEKPFGSDLKSAEALEEMLAKLFKEEQIYRVDHYLGKDVLQNILAFRFSNNMFENSWNNKFIESVEIKSLEVDDVEDRGMFYDGVGALRDVGQNHLLQMLALVTMDVPRTLDSASIRHEREKVFKKLRVEKKIDIHRNSFRGQYRGFIDTKGVNKNSKTETYFRMKCFLEGGRWSGVSFILEAGKALGETKKEILIRFRPPSPNLLRSQDDEPTQNKIIIALEPREEITLRIWSKKPGFSMEVKENSFDLPYRRGEDNSQYTLEYEKLLLDCIEGDQTLFVSTEEVRNMWRFTDPYVKAWSEGVNPLIMYDKGTSDIRDQAKKHLSNTQDRLKKQIGVVGLGKMGAALSYNLTENGWKVYGLNRTQSVTDSLQSLGSLSACVSFDDLVSNLNKPRIVWLMLPAGEPTEEAIRQLSGLLSKGDIVIDGSNNFYEESIRVSKILKSKNINYIDVGVSGGPSGARNGACLMIGGDKEVYEYLLPLFIEVSVVGGHQHFEGIGAGHFAKMVHNGIEYGMMQSIAEGFNILKESDYKYHLSDISNVYNNGSVIESRLIKWMGEAFEIFGDDLSKVSSSAGSGGSGAGGQDAKSEAAWTVEVAEKLGINARVIRDSLQARKDSRDKPTYQGKVINALRNRFGGHDIM